MKTSVFTKFAEEIETVLVAVQVYCELWYFLFLSSYHS